MPSDLPKRRASRLSANRIRAAETLSNRARCPFLKRYCGLLAVLLVVIASVRIVATHTVFSQVINEAAHVACGMEWLDRGVHRYEAQHPPPRGRVRAGILPFFWVACFD
jgi:hypothetical protein